MVCKKCGKELKDDALFCPFCGNNINDAVTKTSPSASVDKSKSKNKNLPIIIAVSVAAGLAAIMLSCCFLSAILGIFDDDTNSDISENQASISTDNNALTATESINQSPPIVILDVTIHNPKDSTDYGYVFQNVSDKDIAYITISEAEYDKMGNRQQFGGGEYTFTGPFYKNQTYTTDLWFYYSPPTAVVYPYKIKVIFFDDSEVTFENYQSFIVDDDFYGGELKN